MLRCLEVPRHSNRHVCAGWLAAEAEQLFMLLEQEVIHEFYCRDKNGVVGGWVARMRESMARLTSRFSANRAVREYVTKLFIPAPGHTWRRRLRMARRARNWSNGETPWKRSGPTCKSGKCLGRLPAQITAFGCRCRRTLLQARPGRSCKTACPGVRGVLSPFCPRQVFPDQNFFLKWIKSLSSL